MRYEDEKPTLDTLRERQQRAQRNAQAREAVVGQLAERIYIRSVYPGADLAAFRTYAWEAARAWYADTERPADEKGEP